MRAASPAPGLHGAGFELWPGLQALGMCPISLLLQPTAGEAPLAELRRVPPRLALPAAAPPLSELLAAPVRASLSCSDNSAACSYCAMAHRCCDCQNLHSVLSFDGQDMQCWCPSSEQCCRLTILIPSSVCWVFWRAARLRVCGSAPTADEL